MNHFLPHIRVATAAIERHGRYLITQRSSTAVLAGLWEFPSCKVETSATDEAALRRELRERLDVDGHENPRESDGRGVAITWLSSRMASGTSGAKNRHRCR
jgi:8-oxo-dGTP pyrophosphatase MutT (NUDIX family)